MYIVYIVYPTKNYYIFFFLAYKSQHFTTIFLPEAVISVVHAKSSFHKKNLYKAYTGFLNTT